MNPQSKQNRLDRDHRIKQEWPKICRKAWPKKKATRHRNERRKVKEMIAAHDDHEHIRSDMKLVMPRSILKKHGTHYSDGVYTLREWIADRRKVRQQREGSHQQRILDRDAHGLRREI